MIISIIETPTIAQPDFWAHATVAHVKMPIHALLKVMEMSYASAVPTTLVTDVLVSSFVTNFNTITQ